jgi:ATP-dependent Lon protease
MSAVRSNIKTVLIPEENRKDLEDVPAEIKDKLKIVPVSQMSEVAPVAIV